MSTTDPLRIAVTGAGSVIGFDAVRILSTYTGIDSLIACNVTPDFAARGLADKYEQSPDFYFGKTHTEEQFISFMLDCTARNGIQVIIPCSIFELKSLARNVELFEESGARVIIEDYQTVATFEDKLATAHSIGEIGGYSPYTQEITERDGVSKLPSRQFPFLIKPRYGYGSKAVTVIQSEQEFSVWDQSKPEKHRPYVAQDYLPSDDKEYSCSILYDKDGSPMSVMAVLRNSVKGITLTATYNRECHPVEEYLFTTIAPRLKGKYCLNLQLRVEDGKPTIFEVNPRFGASEAIRRIFGQDPYFSILRQYYDIQCDVLNIRYGKAIRAYTEVYIPDDHAER